MIVLAAVAAAMLTTAELSAAPPEYSDPPARQVAFIPSLLPADDDSSLAWLSGMDPVNMSPVLSPGHSASAAAHQQSQAPSQATKDWARLADNRTFVDYDAYLREMNAPGAMRAPSYPVPANEPWHWQILPSGLIYSSYLADTKESRLAAHIVEISDVGWTFDGILGGRVGLLRYGTSDPIRPIGFQVDAEGSGQVRLNIPDDVDVSSVDFRAGVPITFGWGRHRTRLGYYHLSSHVGDEFLLKNPQFDRLNFARDVLYIGHAIYLTPRWRIYGQVGWAFYTDVSEPWEFLAGIEYAPCAPTGIHGAPFLALNAHLREEVDFGGSLTFQTGWAWRGDNSGMLRAGLHYLNGKSNQYSFYNEFEQQIGFGLWYDF